MRDTMAKLLLASAARLPMPAPQGCIAIALRGTSGNWDGVARTGPFSDPNPPAPRFLIYSLTKTFIAALALKLAEQGRIKLDDAVAEYLPSAPFGGEATIRQLLQHTGGLPDYGALPAYQNAVRTTPERAWSDAEFIARTCANGPTFAPGTGWQYSNIGYLLLKQAIAEICQCPFGEALRTMIFAPLGLSTMSVPATLADLNALVPGHSTYWSDGGTLRDVRGRYHPGWVAHGVIASTAADVAHFYHALFAGEVVAPNLLAEMKRGVRVPGDHPPFRTPSYGLGLMTDPDSPVGPLYGHSGEGPGYRAAAYHVTPANGAPATMVALANTEIDMQALGFSLAAAATQPGLRV